MEEVKFGNQKEQKKQQILSEMESTFQGMQMREGGVQTKILLESLKLKQSVRSTMMVSMSVREPWNFQPKRIA